MSNDSEPEYLPQRRQAAKGEYDEISLYRDFPFFLFLLSLAPLRFGGSHICIRLVDEAKIENLTDGRFFDRFELSRQGLRAAEKKYHGAERFEPHGPLINMAAG